MIEKSFVITFCFLFITWLVNHFSVGRIISQNNKGQNCCISGLYSFVQWNLQVIWLKFDFGFYYCHDNIPHHVLLLYFRMRVIQAVAVSLMTVMTLPRKSTNLLN